MAPRKVYIATCESNDDKPKKTKSRSAIRLSAERWPANLSDEQFTAQTAGLNTSAFFNNFAEIARKELKSAKRYEDGTPKPVLSSEVT